MLDLLALLVLVHSSLGMDVDASVHAQLSVSGAVDVMIHMSASLEVEDVDLAHVDLADRGRRRELVHNHLVAQSDAAQHGLRTTLSRMGAAFQAFWIVNAIAVRGMSVEMLGKVAQGHAHEIRAVTLMGSRSRHAPVDMESEIESGSEHMAGLGQPWNIELVGAPKAWASGVNGSGITLATLDGGVSYMHEALVDGYRGNVGDGKFVHDYSWRDWAYKRSEPEDSDGHGTNVQGIASASHGYGVAPGAKWFTGKIFNFAGYSADDWQIAGCQFVMCPTPTHASTPENCSLGADVVSNSWGEDTATSDFLKPVIAAWLKAGMVPVFAVGNAGPQCGTSVAPSDYAGVLAVGATDKRDDICGFSSRGPAANSSAGPLPFSPLAPSIVAPGLSIAGPSYDDISGYTGFTGTSQAAPHVAGAAAVLLSAAPHLSPAEVATALYDHASTSLKEPDTGKEVCAGQGWPAFPNFIYGHGRLDVYAALKAVLRK